MAVDSASNVSDNKTRDVGRADSIGGAANDDVASGIDADINAVSASDVKAQASEVVGPNLVDDSVQRVGGNLTVQPGDNLTHIARDQGVSLSSLIEANPQIKDPNLIHPGETLNLPAGAGRSEAGAGVPNPGSVDGLTRGAVGPEVRDLQQKLTDLGYATGPVDGQFGPITQSAVRRFQSSNDLPTSGTIDEATSAMLQSGNAQGPRPLDPGEVPQLGTYPPGSPEQIALFQQAAQQAGLPESWASSPGLINILRRESNGRVGVPNYTYGARATDPSQWASVHNELKAGNITARSSATGLGQLLLSNVDRYYPSGRAGIGNPVEEAAGMMKYIQDRYGNPDNAWAQYGVHHEGY